MKAALDWIGEERARQAAARGELSHLPGEGRPLVFDEDPLAPEALRVTWRLLRGAGLVGPGTAYDGPMPTTFAAMMSLVDRRRGDSRRLDGAGLVRQRLLIEARWRRWGLAQGAGTALEGEGPVKEAVQLRLRKGRTAAAGLPTPGET